MNSQAIAILGTKSLTLQRNLFEQTSPEIIKLDASDDIKFFKISPDASLMMWAKNASIEIVSLNRLETQTQIPIKRAQISGFSPKNSFLWVWCFPSAFKSNDPEENFKLFKITLESNKFNLECVYQSEINNYNYSTLFWASDESFCLQYTPNIIRVFKEGIVEKQISLPGLFNLSMSSGCVAECIESLDANFPSFVKLHKYPQLTSNSLSSQAFRNKKEFLFYWNHKGNILIFTCVDKNQKNSVSYYGQQEVYFLGHKGESFQIEFSSKEDVFDISWFPESDKFAIIHGSSPSIVTLYDHKGDPIYNLSSGPYSRIIINSSETLLCLCGMGGIKGHTEFWSIKERKITCLMNTPLANELAWLPDGVHMVFSSTSPRINFDNGYEIYDFSGTKIRDFVSKSIGTHSESFIQIEPLLIGDFTFPTPVVIASKAPIDLRSTCRGAYVPPSTSRFNLETMTKNTTNTKKNKKKATKKKKEQENSSETNQKLDSNV
uniref:Eukaryotic translation initiation factor 2A (Trinotate prediction) n=1 Tax=Myxobolus squamalis TaxID=59785 RepID=A0A6B2FX15_MYXSQ